MSAIGDGGQAAIVLMPDTDGTHVHIFESSQLEDSYVGDLLYSSRLALGSLKQTLTPGTGMKPT